MTCAVLANAVLLAHLAFVLFVVAGGLLVWRWHWLAWVHLPAVAWAVFVELTGRVCPLTPLEDSLRACAGAAAGGGEFIARWLPALLYPPGLERPWQIGLGVGALAINLAVYAWIHARRRDHTRP